MTDQPTSQTWTDRKPLEEIANRVATAGAGLATAAKAVALEDHRRMLADAAQRVRDSHQLQMRVLGADVSNDDVDEDMGDIIISGDHITNPPPATPTPARAEAPKILPYVLAAALAGGGLGALGPIAYGLLNREPQKPPAFTDTDTQYELRISSGEGDEA